jgi:hypothetical protein
MKKSTLGKDWSLYYWALEYATDLGHPKRLAWVVEVLPKIPGPYNNQQVVERLAGRKVNPELFPVIDQVFREATDQKIKIQLAGDLLRQTNKDEYHTYLRELVNQREPAGEYTGRTSRAAAADAILRAAVDSGQRRAEAYALLKSLLNEQPVTATRPSEFTEVWAVRYLGLLGNKDDVPVLRKHAEDKDDSVASQAIHALAHVDPAAAKELIQRRLELHLAGEPSWRNLWKLSRLFGIIAWQRDPAAIPLLKKAWERHLQSDLTEEDHAYDQYVDPQSLIRFLEAKDVAGRLQALQQFNYPNNSDDHITQKIVKQLIAEGADEKSCAPLLIPSREGHRRGR